MIWLVVMSAVCLRATSIVGSSVEITDGDRWNAISVGDNFTLTCSMKFTLYQGLLKVNETESLPAEEEIIPEESSLLWELPNRTKIEIFTTATTQCWPKSRNGILCVRKRDIVFENVDKTHEGVYKCHGNVVVRQQTGQDEVKYSRNSSDVYHVHVYNQEDRIHRLMRPTVCVAEGKEATWVGSFVPGTNVTVTSWKAFDKVDEFLSRPIEDIPRLAEKSTTSYQLDGKLTQFGFSEFMLRNKKAEIDDPGHYIITAENEKGHVKTSHVELIVAASKREIEISPLPQEGFVPGAVVNVSCTMKRSEAHSNRITMHFAKCVDVQNCTNNTYSSISSVIFAYPYGNPCWLGLPSPPPKDRPETVTILNFKVETPGVFFCGKDYFSSDASMPLRTQVDDNTSFL